MNEVRIVTGGIPHKVNETLWRNSSDLGLRLFVPVPRDRNNGAELQSATLNLFLKPNAGRILASV